MSKRPTKESKKKNKTQWKTKIRIASSNNYLIHEDMHSKNSIYILLAEFIKWKRMNSTHNTAVYIRRVINLFG